MRPYQHYPAVWIIGQILVTAGLVSFLISLVGGWWTLSRSYRTDRPMPPKSFLISGSFRYLAGYQNVIRANSNTEGLYLKFWPRLAHPPLFIPWTDIVVKKPFRIIFRMQTMMLGRAGWVPFTTTGTDVERLLKRANRPPAP